MTIQWFPGHMTKALRMMEENVKIVDAIGYVLDARAPLSCFNPQFRKIVGNKPCVFILNKCDLADPEKIELWCDYFRKKGAFYVKATATASAEARNIVAALEKATASISAKYKAKGIFKPVRCMIVGVPNCGKSTLINCLCGRKTVVTGDKPGVTKGKQWVRLSNGLELLDTPGTLWPKFDDESAAYRLCFIGSIKDDVVDMHEVALELLSQLFALYPSCLTERFGLTSSGAAEAFDEIAVKRGYILRGGETDVERCAKAIVEEFRKGRLGRITLDVPSGEDLL